MPIGTTTPRARTAKRSRRSGRRTTAVLVGAALVAAACSGSTRTSTAPVLTVVTGLWPVAQAAAEIGQGNVVVDDVVPPGDDPRAYTLSPAATARVRHAGVVIEVGGGFQPSFEAAAAGATHTLRLLPSQAASPYVWLSPYTMKQAGQAIAGALERANPKAAGTYRTGLANLEAALGSLDADYQTTLTACPDHTLVTVDAAFAGLRTPYGVVDTPIVVGPLTPIPSAAAVKREVAAIRATGAKKIYTESWIPESDILGASARARVQVGTLATLEGPTTATPWAYAAGARYVSLMETNLSTISSALHCPNPADN